VNLTFPNRVKEVNTNNLSTRVDGDEFEENNVYTYMSTHYYNTRL
jgi:hypothetical protein